ncbi:hypothetical protein KBC31_02870 [Candidatus Saccharibacteria bacterium]|nr:hypothetical protein [Candidatus Saccharibacteria bacterium]
MPDSAIDQTPGRPEILGSKFELAALAGAEDAAMILAEIHFVFDKERGPENYFVRDREERLVNVFRVGSGDDLPSGYRKLEEEFFTQSDDIPPKGFQKITGHVFPARLESRPVRIAMAALSRLVPMKLLPLDWYDSVWGMNLKQQPTSEVPGSISVLTYRDTFAEVKRGDNEKINPHARPMLEKTKVPRQFIERNVFVREGEDGHRIAVFRPITPKEAPEQVAMMDISDPENPTIITDSETRSAVIADLNKFSADVESTYRQKAAPRR